MKVILCDFARVILLPRDLQYRGTLAALHEKIRQTGSAFLSLNELNEELLSFLELLPQQKYIFTAGTAHNNPEISKRVFEVFNSAYTTLEIGYSKAEPKAFELVAKEIGQPITDIFFIDDILENVQAAQEAGMTAVQFTTNDSVTASLTEWLQEIE